MRRQLSLLIAVPLIVGASSLLAPAARADFEAEGHISIGAGDDQSGRGTPPPAPPPARASAPPVYGPPPGPPPRARYARDGYGGEGIRRHDGTYVRMGLGGGAMSFTDTNDGSPDSNKSAGGGLAFDFSVGGTLNPGIVIGGTLLFQQASKPTTTLTDGTTLSNDTNANLLILGPFVEWYPNPEQGFHLGVFLGIADMTASDQNGRTLNSNKVPIGVGGGAQVGYDFWFADQWSFGVGARFAGASVATPAEASGAPVLHRSVGTGQLLLSIVYH